MRLFPTDKSKDKLKKKYEKLWSKIRYLIRIITNKSSVYDEKHMKIKFNSGDDLPLNKSLHLPNMIIVVRSVSLKVANITHKFS